MWCIHREFSYESPGERILKIGQHLPKLLSNVKGLTFLGHSVHSTVYPVYSGTFVHICSAGFVLSLEHRQKRTLVIKPPLANARALRTAFRLSICLSVYLSVCSSVACFFFLMQFGFGERSFSYCLRHTCFTL